MKDSAHLDVDTDLAERFAGIREPIDASLPMATGDL